MCVIASDDLISLTIIAHVLSGILGTNLKYVHVHFMYIGSVHSLSHKVSMYTCIYMYMYMYVLLTCR